ncbi:hypothetical protein BsWGS_10965 [Bradybaena similaris]
MAEFDNESANLDLFNEIINPRLSADETADVDAVVTRTVVTVNNVDSNSTKPTHNGIFQKTFSSNNSVINDFTSSSDTINFQDEAVTAEDARDHIRLNNAENEQKRTAAVNSSVADKNDVVVDSKTGSVYDDQCSIVSNGKENVIRTDEKTCGKQKKGISFPKDTFISDYFEPPDPWQNAPSWTADELVSAYKKSCELHGTKPISKLVQQLQTCCPGRQEESLCLKGEKLDQKQCESLEEVLRRVQFKLLDLEASHLDDECAVALFDMIEYYESACQLNISSNKNIQARGWQACSRLVRRTPNLSYLDVRSCDLNDRNIPIFGRALKLGCHLTILHMENINLSGRPLVILVAALKMNEVLQELFLAENKLMPTDGVQLGNLLRYNHKLSLLDLRNNHLQDVGTSHIADGLMEQGKGPGLRTLVLWNNAINYQAMPALGRALAVNETLETLNIGHNSLTNEGVHLLKEGLLKTNSLLRLGLQGTRITDEGAVALAEYIADSTILLRIDLRDNEIKTGGLMALSHAMRVNTSITRIDLDKEPKKESSMKDYAEQQSLLLRDIYTFQQRNIQTAVQREEKERADIQQKVDTVSPATNQEEGGDEQMEESLPSDNSSADSAAIPGHENELCDSDVKQEKDRKDAENIKTKSIEERLKESQNQIEQLDNDEVDSSVAKEDVKNRQRPSMLFPYFGLPPQASLDSPLPTSSVSPLVSVLSESVSAPHPPQPPQTSQKDHLTLNVGIAPGEMILSPQYFPKQIARKIFSVSRVKEDSSLSRMSTSPTPANPSAATFDPLNVSSVPLIPVSSPLSSSSSSLPPSSPVLVPRSAARVQQAKAETRVSVSPSSMLFQKLAEETVRNMISPIVDRAVKGVLSQSSETFDPNDSSKIIVTDSKIVPAFCESLNTFTSSNQAMLFTAPSACLDTIDICDSQKTPLVDTGNTSSSEIKSSLSTSPEDLTVINSVKENTTLNDFTQGGEEILQQELFFIPENTQNKAGGNSLEISYSSYKTETEVSDILREIQEVNVCKRETECDVESPESLTFVVKESAGSAAHISQLASDNTSGAGGDAAHGKDIPDKAACATLYRQQHASDMFSESSLMSLTGTLDREKYSSPIMTDGIMVDELTTVCLNNSSSPALLLPEDSLEVTSDRCESYGNEEQSFSSFEDLGSLDIGASGHKENMQVNSSDTSVKSTTADVSRDCPGSHTDVHNSASDSVGIENVDFSLDEESWLTVGAENENNTTDKCKPSSTQPDFFTTLSLNGLTQELASALTSLDGATTSYETEDDATGDLRPHDEFERELDAMLALVQSDLPWPLKES